MTVVERASVGYISSEILFPSSLEVLPHVPPTEIRKEQLDPLGLYVATHELQHALVGKDFGLTVNEISTVPEGSIGGYTSFAPTRNIASFQIAAAASMVQGPHGDPFGFGHDEQQIHYLSLLSDSLTLEQAYGRAARKLSQYPLIVRERAAEIIAYLEKVPGSMIETILERARREVQEQQVEKILPELEIYSESMGEYEGDLSEFTIVLRRLPNGEVVEQMIEVKVCGTCGGRNGHEVNCELLVDNESILESTDDLLAA